MLAAFYVKKNGKEAIRMAIIDDLQEMAKTVGLLKATVRADGANEELKAQLAELAINFADFRADAMMAGNGWVTMNGTHVLIGAGGTVVGGPSRLQGMKYRQYYENHSMATGSNKAGKVTYKDPKESGQSYISQALHAQGFDGKPKIVDSKEFNKAKKDSMFVAQRIYTGTSKSIVEAYQQQFYSGTFYVDCTDGGAQYGKGMYCSSDLSGKLSAGVKTEMAHYKELGADKGAKHSITETVTLDPSAKRVKFGDVRGEYIKHVTEQLGEKPNAAVKAALEGVRAAASDVDDKPGWMISAGMSASSYKTAALGDAYKKLKYEVGKQYGEAGKNAINDAINRAKEASHAKEFGHDGIDFGVLAAECGYDAIDAVGHGKSGCYTVVLNRSKLLVKGDPIHKDSMDEIEIDKKDYSKVIFKYNSKGILEGWLNGRKVGEIYTMGDMGSSEKSARHDAMDAMLDVRKCVEGLKITNRVIAAGEIFHTDSANEHAEAYNRLTEKAKALESILYGRIAMDLNRFTADAGNWKTINGTHVLIGEGGTFLSGPLKGQTYKPLPKGRYTKTAWAKLKKDHPEEAKKKIEADKKAKAEPKSGSFTSTKTFWKTELDDAPEGSVVHLAYGDYTKQADGKWHSADGDKIDSYDVAVANDAYKSVGKGGTLDIKSTPGAKASSAVPITEKQTEDSMISYPIGSKIKYPDGGYTYVKEGAGWSANGHSYSDKEMAKKVNYFYGTGHTPTLEKAAATEVKAAKTTSTTSKPTTGTATSTTTLGGIKYSKTDKGYSFEKPDGTTGWISKDDFAAKKAAESKPAEAKTTGKSETATATAKTVSTEASKPKSTPSKPTIKGMPKKTVGAEAQDAITADAQAKIDAGMAMHTHDAYAEGLREKHEADPDYNQRTHNGHIGSMPYGSKPEKAVELVMKNSKMTKAEAQIAVSAINDFSLDGFKGIRRASTGESSSAVRKAQAEAIENYIKKMPKWSGGTIYRGIGITEKEYDDLMNKVQSKQPLSQYGPSSFSSDENTAMSFSEKGSGRHVIFVQNGTNKGVSIKNLSQISHENEVIMSSSWRGVATNYEQKGDYTYIYVDELP